MRTRSHGIFGSLSWLLAAAGFWAGSEGLAQNPADSSASSGIVGFQRVLVGDGWRAVGPPLEPFAVVRAEVVGAQANVLLLDLAGEAWGLNQWSGYEVVMNSGLGIGRRYQIAGNSADSLLLAGGSDPAAEGVFPGDVVSISPTLEEYLSGQVVSGDLNTSDWVATFYRNTLIKLHRDSKGQWVDEQGVPARLTVSSGRGFLVNLLAAGEQPRFLFLAGEWNGDGGAGYMARGQQIISVPLTGEPQTLHSTIGATAVGPNAGVGPMEGDQLTVLNEFTGEYRTCGLDAKGQWQWQDTGEPAGALVIEPGRGYLYDHVGDGFSWQWR